MIKCPMCHGKKKVEGMGYMMHSCPRCSATGLVDDDKDPVNNVLSRSEKMKLSWAKRRHDKVVNKN